MAPVKPAAAQPPRARSPALVGVVVAVGNAPLLVQWPMLGGPITVPSMSVVCGSDPGVARVRMPQATSEPVRVVVQLVCVGPETDPWSKPEPYDV